MTAVRARLRQVAPARKGARLGIVIALFVAGLLPAAHAQQQGIRELYVPAEQPETWPEGNWRVQTVEAYRRMRSDLATGVSTPRRAILRSAIYRGDIIGDSLVNGRVTIETGLRGSDPEFVWLGRPTCAIGGLSWSDGPADWGLTATGETVLLVRRDGESLSGDCSLRGREFFGHVELSATLPPAVVSTLEIRTPIGKRLSANGAISVEKLPVSDSEWQTWRIDLGRKTEFRLRVSDETSSSEPAVSFVDRMTACSFLPDRLEVQADFQVEALRGETSDLSFVVSEGLEVTSLILGAEIELPFRRVQQRDGVRVLISTDSLTTEGRTTLRLRGSMPLPAEGRLILPTVGLDRFQLLSSRLHVTVHRPLELRDYAVTDCRLLSSTLVRHQSDRLEFEDWSETSQVTVQWDAPQAEIAAEVLSVIDTDRSDPVLRTVMKLTPRSGSTYELTCQVPPDWRVSRVASEPWHRSPRVAAWKTQKDLRGATQLWMEFRDALSQGAPITLEIWATRESNTWEPSFPAPVILPDVTELQRVDLLIRRPIDYQVTLPLRSPFREAALSGVRRAWSGTILNWDAWLSETLNALPPLAAVSSFQAESPIDREATSFTLVATANTAAASGDVSAVEALDVPSDHPQAGENGGASQSLMADLSIRSRVPFANEQTCVHTLTYQLRRPSTARTLTFTLPAPAEMIAARIDGANVRNGITDRTAQLVIPAGGPAAKIELEFRVPFESGLLGGAATVPLPTSELLVASIGWKIQAPSGWHVQSDTTGTTLQSPSITWRQRILGPLGRMHRVSTPAAPNTGRDEHLHLPDNGDVTTMTGEVQTTSRSVPYQATRLQLSVWNENAARHFGWVLLIVGLTAGLLAQRIRVPRLGRLTTVLLLSAGTASLLAAEEVVIPAGGLLMGLLAGSVLPFPADFAWDRLRVRPHLGSSWRLVRTASPVILIAIAAFPPSLLAWQQPQPGDDTAARPAPGPNEDGNAKYDVLIPVTSGEPTLDETMVVYVSRDLLTRWDALQSWTHPPYLVRKVAYDVVPDYRPVPRITAKFEVLVFEGGALPRIALPLRGIVLESGASCRVNGRDAPVVPLRDGAGLVVDASELGSTRIAAPSSDDPVSNSQVTCLEIEVVFRPREPVTGAGRRFEIEIPPLLWTTVDVRQVSPRSPAPVVESWGAATQDGDPQRLRVDLGPIGRMNVDWLSAEKSPVNSELSPELAVSSLEVHPLQARIRTRFTLRSETGPNRRARRTAKIPLPASASLGEVRASGLIDSLVTRTDDSLLLQLALEGRDTEKVTVDVDYTVPLTTVQESTRLPDFPFVGGAPGDFARHVMGLAARPGFRLPPITPQGDGDTISAVTPTSFAQAWGQAQPLPVDWAFAVTTPRSFDVVIAPIRPVREARVQETLTFDRLQTAWEAQVELDCRAAPVALHRLQVDPRIRVSSVTVHQDGADRLARWARTDEQFVTVLLTEALTGPQSLHVAGTAIAADAGDLIELPRFQVVNATHLSHELTIRTPSGTGLQVFDKEGAVINADKFLEASDASTPAGQETRAFNLLAAAAPEGARIQDAPTAFSFDRVLVLDIGDDNELMVRTLLQVSGDPSTMPRQIDVDVPPIWAQDQKFQAPPEFALAAKHPDGSQSLALQSSRSAPLQTLEFAARVPRPSEDPWTVEPISLPQGQVVRDYLILSENLEYEVVNDTVPATNDEALQSILSSFPHNGASSRSFLLLRGPWRLSAQRHSGPDNYVARTESAVWETETSEIAGVTLVEMRLSPDAEVQLKLPPRVKAVFAAWDGRPLPLPQDSSDPWIISPSNAVGSAVSHRVQIWWEIADPGLPVRKAIPLPTIGDLPVQQERVIFLGSERSRSLTAGGWSRLNEWDPSGAMPASHSPVVQALQAAGGTAQAEDLQKGLGSTAAVRLVQWNGTQPPGATLWLNLWSISWLLQRIVIAALVALALMLLETKFKVRQRITTWELRPLTRAWGGATLLAALIWILEPGAPAFVVLLVCAVGWGLSAWLWRTPSSLATDPPSQPA